MIIDNLSNDKRIKSPNRDKKKKQINVDGVPIENVEKSEVVKKSKEEEEREELSTEDDVLFSLFRSSGIHSAMKHDKIERADKDDYVFVEREAERVASTAITRLRESSAQCRQNNGLTGPTWTGNNSNSGEKDDEGKPAKKRPRFGKPSGAPITSPWSPKITKKVANKGSMGIDISSSALLERMKKHRTSSTSLFTNCTRLQTDHRVVTTALVIHVTKLVCH